LESARAQTKRIRTVRVKNDRRSYAMGPREGAQTRQQGLQFLRLGSSGLKQFALNDARIGGIESNLDCRDRRAKRLCLEAELDLFQKRLGIAHRQWQFHGADGFAAGAAQGRRGLR